MCVEVVAPQSPALRSLSNGDVAALFESLQRVQKQSLRPHVLLRKIFPQSLKRDDELLVTKSGAFAAELQEHALLGSADAVTEVGWMFEILQRVVSSCRPSLLPNLGNPDTEVYIAPFEEVKAQCILSESLQSWELDTLALAEATGNRPLSALAPLLFQRHGLVEHFGLREDFLMNFFAEVEAGYDDSVAYHNRAHAASVLFATHALLEHTTIAEDVAAVCPNLSPEAVRMGCLIAAATHDYEHRGLNNDFLAKAGDARAARSGGARHANEQHHFEAAMEVLARPECNFLSEFSPEELDGLRGLIEVAILGTDIADHKQILDAFAQASSSSDIGGASCFKPSSEEEAMLLIQMALKCADLGHLALGWDAHVQWVQRLEEELFTQGDQEKALGRPASFLMDRERPGASATQVGFFNFVVLPLFRAMASAAPGSQTLLEGVVANYQRWQELESAE